MALQVWLPLNGDLHNQGLNQSVTLSAVGNPTIENDGKIGKCYAFDGSSYFQSQENFLTGMTECSLACWVKDTYTGNSWMRIFGIGEHTRVHLDTNGAAGQVRFFVSKDGSTGQYWGPIGKTNLKDSTWHHVCGTFDSQTCKIYIDGKCEATVNTGSLPTATGGKLYLAHVANGVKLNGKLNDIRIYDHALSAKEVEEIAKGLVLHYKLDNNGMGGENLFTWTNNATGITLNNYQNTGSFTQFTNSLNFDPSTTVGEKYTISFWAKSPNGTTSLLLYNNNSKPKYFKFYTTLTSNLNTEWQYFKYTVTNIQYTGSDANTNTKIWKRIEIYAPNKMGVIVKQIKVEKGDKVTAWSPSPSDAIYPADFKTTIYDSSGYSHNGTIVGSLTVAAGSPRYDVASFFGAYNTPSVQLNNPSVLASLSDCAICWWYNHTATSTTSLPFNMDTSHYIGAQGSSSIYDNNVGTNAVLYKDGVVETNRTLSNAVVYHNGVLYNQNQWHFFVLNHANLTTWTKFYINHYDSNWPANAYISDLRIYATPLTDAQVAELYNTSMLVDASGNIIPRGLED